MHLAREGSPALLAVRCCRWLLWLRLGRSLPASPPACHPACTTRHLPIHLACPPSCAPSCAATLRLWVKAGSWRSSSCRGWRSLFPCPQASFPATPCQLVSPQPACLPRLSRPACLPGEGSIVGLRTSLPTRYCKSASLLLAMGCANTWCGQGGAQLVLTRPTGFSASLPS